MNVMRKSALKRALRSVLGVVSVAALGIGLAACGSENGSQGGTNAAASESKPITLKLAGPKSPPSLPMLRMIESKALGDNVTMEFSPWSTSDELTGFVTGGYNFVAMPLSTGVMLHNKGIDVKQLDISAWDVMDLVTTDPEVKSIADLKGKTVTIAMKSSAFDFTTQKVLEANGMTIGKDVNIEYVAPTEGPALVLSGKTKNFVAIHPQVEMLMGKDPNIRIVGSFQKEWNKITGKDIKLPTAGVVVNGAFAKEHPELVNKFETEYEKAAKWVSENPQEAGKLAEAKLGINAVVFAKAIPNIDWQVDSADKARPAIEEYFKQIGGLDPAATGGKLPPDDFYYTAKGEK